MNETISIIIPVLNESKNIPILYEKIKESMDGLNYEIIFVDDGSSDNTFELLKSIVEKNPAVKAIKLRKNFGKAAAYSAGFENSNGDIIVTMDGDLQDDPAEIHKFLKKIEEGYDVVSGWKYRGKGRFDKAIASKFFNKITSFMTGIKLHDFNCPFKAYRKEVLNNISLYGDLYRFIPVLVYERGYKIGEIKIENYPRKFGKSKYKINRYIRAFLDLITVLFLTKFKKSPLYLFGNVGLSVFMVGFLIDLYLTYKKIFHGLVLSQQPILFLGILLMIIGAQFISIGLITEMMVNIFHERKDVSIIKEIFTRDKNRNN